MCGVVGIFLNRSLRDSDIALGRALRAQLSHRGPNGDGEFADPGGGVWLGHTRLAIQDLSAAAAQPMSVAGTSLSYNGEIYNFPALRSDLIQNGDSFTSSGDTEVLLRGWARYGREFLTRIDGMFSFALWEGREAWLAGDIFGEKTLYIATRPEGIYVCSELAPLAKLLNAQARLDGSNLHAFLALGYIPYPSTARTGIRRLAPAGLMRIRDGRIVEETTYWSSPALTPGRDAITPLSDAELDLLRDALCRSLEGRLLSDAPICLFLSGGIDSGLIAALCRRELGINPPCISVRFSDSAADECATAARVAAHLELNHCVVDNLSPDTMPTPDWLLELFGQPNDNLTAASVFSMSASASSAGFRVGLTGMGSDELMLAYQKASFFWRYARLFDLPWPLRREIARLLAAAGHVWPRAATAAMLAAQPNEQRYLTIKNLPANQLLRGIPGFDDWAASMFGTVQPAWLEAAHFDASSVMPSSQLPALDLGSMRASLELRTPFLSRDILQALTHIDPRRLLAYGQKEPLRRLLRRYLPQDITALPKRGFVLPQRRFLDRVGLTSPPAVPGIPPSVSDAIWARRMEPGFDRLGVRLVLAERFLTAS